MGARRLETDLRAILFLLAAGMAVSAWIAWAEHPTARNLWRAIRDT